MQPSLTEAKALLELEQYCRNWVAPRAAAMDQSTEVLQAAFQGLGARSLLTLRVATQWNGHGLTTLEYWQAQRILARHSGSLAFLQTQHQSAANFIANGRNPVLKASYLSAMARGERGVGVGFSHLRRRGEPCLRAIALSGGYLLNGSIPWATGWGIFDQLVAGATLPDGRSLLALIPFTHQPNDSLICSDVMDLAALAVTNTAALQIKDWFVAEDQVIDRKPADWLEQSDRRNVLKATSFLMGCSEAALDVVQQQLGQSSEVWRKLDQAVQHCQQHILEALAGDSSFEAKLALRADAIALCHRCAQAAVIASGGAANLLSHPAQRIYREALVFGVSGQTFALKTASLEALTSDLD